MPNNNDRRKLKPKRFDKFERTESNSTRNSSSINTDHVPTRGSKRPNTESPNVSVNKKKCYGLMHPPPQTVNLANNRLKKLKQNLQAGLKVNKHSTTSTATNSSASVEVNSSVSKSNTDNLEPKNLNHLKSPSSSKNIYQNLNKWANQPESSPSGSSANERMSRLKKVIMGTPKFSDSSGLSNNSRFFTPNSSNPYSNSTVISNNQFFSNSNNRESNTDKPINSSSFHFNHLNSPSSSKNIYENLNKWDNQPEPSPSGSSANERMSRLKKVKIGTPKFSDSSGLSNNSKFFTPNSSNPYSNSTVVSNNQFFSNFNNSESNTDKPINSLSSRILKIRKKTEQINNNNEYFDKTKFVHAQKYVTPISERLKLKRKINSINNNDSIDIKQNVSRDILISDISENNTQSFKSNSPLKNFNDTRNTSTPISERLKSKRNTSGASPYDKPKYFRSFDFKEPHPTPILTQESLSLNNPTPREQDEEKICADVYKEKMSMTASWIRNHQQFSKNFVTPPRTSEAHDVHNDSLNISPPNLDTSQEMEWTNAEPDDTLEIRENPENEIKAPNATQANENVQISTQTEPVISKIEKIQKEKFLCIVVDTNVFISELSKLTDIITLKISGPVQPLIYIPWMVITELDELKDRSGDSKLKQKAFSAIKFINKSLSENNPRVKGQSVTDMGHQKHIGTSPDDKIMACCIQALEKYESVILLSNDINLKNKAMINDINASSANEIIMKIMSNFLKTTKTKKISQKMSMKCSEIICACAKDAYGDVWTKMDLLSNPPWPFSECLIRFKKYWIAVFQEKVLKHFLPAVEKLQRLLIDNKDICDDTDEYIEFVKLSLNLCIFLKDMEEFRASIETIINDITKIE